MRSLAVLPLLAALVAACAADDAPAQPQPAAAGQGGAAGGAGAAGSAGLPPEAKKICAPYYPEPCPYGGPKGTEGVGACKAGVRLCNHDGTGFGECVGEVRPSKEDCNTDVDDDCDPTTTCPGELVWSAALQSDSTVEVSGVAATPDGGVVAVGSLKGKAQLGPFAVEAQGEGGSYDLFVARFDASGQPLWLKIFGDDDYQYGTGVAVDAEGNAVVVGYYEGSLAFGSIELPLASDVYGAYAAKLDKNGDAVWARGFPGGAYGDAVAVHKASGTVVVAGHTSGKLGVDLGSGAPLTGNSAFALALDAYGAYLWHQSHASSGDDIVLPNGIAVDSQGNTLLAGWFKGQTDLGSGPVTSTPSGFGSASDDLFLVKLGPDGAPLWSKTFGDERWQRQMVVACDAGGNVLLCGAFDGAVSFGGPSLDAPDDEDAFVAKLDPAGNHVFSRRFGASGAQGCAAVAADAQGNVLLVGSFEQAINLGGADLVWEKSAGNIAKRSAFFAKLDPAGKHVFSRQVGDWEEQNGTAAALDASGSALVGGRFLGTVTFGPKTFLAKQTDGNYATSSFVAKLSP